VVHVIHLVTGSTSLSITILDPFRPCENTGRRVLRNAAPMRNTGGEPSEKRDV
jgi:hypothetical protein